MKDDTVVESETATIESESPTWLGEPVCTYTCGIAEIATKLPRFDRRPFSLTPFEPPSNKSAPTQQLVGENRLWDVVVRLPLNTDERETPVGLVSKRYTLVQHRDLFEKTCRAIEDCGIKLDDVEPELTLSLYGSKMALSFGFPKHFDFDPGDGHKLRLRLHCVNSVDARTRLRITLGWLRLVCGNGLVVGTAQLSQMFVHNEYLQLPNIVEVLGEGLELAEKEKPLFAEWVAKPVANDRLNSWTDTALREKWGPLAASRVHLICETGFDGEFAKPGEKAPPSRKLMNKTVSVPGAPTRSENAYHVCQALAWVAHTRKDIQDQLDGMRDLPGLMETLLI